VLDGIGNTPAVELKKIVPAGSARVLLKLEWANPTGSMKDRMAKAAIEAAESDGRLSPGATIVEYTAGTTGISLALVAAAKGYGLEIVYSDAFSIEKRKTMLAFGAKITDVPSGGIGITEKLIKEMIGVAADISARPNHWYSDQLRNHDAIKGYYAIGEELWKQTDGRIDAFAHCVGTAHSIHGITEALWKHNPKVHITAIEPAESPIISEGRSGAHRIEGIGLGFIVPLWNPALVNEVQTVSSADAQAMARRLAREEGIFAGASTGANVIVALRLAERLGAGATVATLAVDSGLRYLSTPLYS
jgi:cysteine synthase A